MQQSVHFGKYAYPIGFDDVAYLSDAISRIYSWNRGIPLWQLHAEMPPHSPVYIYLAMLGFSLAGYIDWVPVAMCGFFLLFASERVLSAFDQKNILAGILAIVFFLSLPLCRYVVTHFRPDMVTGLALGYGGFLFIREQWTSYPWRAWGLGGAVFGVALLLKPAYSPATLVLFCAAMGCAILSGGIREFLRAPSKAFKLGFWAIGGLAVVALPHFIWAWRPIYTYIYINMFGAYKNMWNLQMSTYEQVRYYLNGPGGETMIGRSAWAIIIAMSLLAFALALWRKDLPWLKKCFSYLLYTLSAYIVVSATTYMTPFLGAAFFGAVAVGSVASIWYIVSEGHKYLRFVLISFLSVYIVFVLTGKPFKDNAFTSSDDANLYKKSVSQIVDDLHYFSGMNKNIVITTCETAFVGETLRYELLKRHFHPMKVIDLHRESSQENAVRQINQADAVVTIEEAQTTYLPSYAWLNLQTAALNSDPQFARIGRYPLGTSGMVALLYAKKLVSGFGGLPMGANGFKPVEGPYPERNLPLVQWARDERPTLRIPPSVKAQKLILEMLPAGQNMRISIIVGTDAPRDIILPTQSHFIREEIIIPPSSIEQLVQLIISEPPKETLPLRVLFKSLLLVPEPMRSISQH